MPERVFAAHQPNLLPWLPFWAKADAADVFGLLPSVQFSKGDWHNRVYLGRDSAAQLLSIPVSVHLGQRIDEALVAETFRLEKVIGALRACYGRTRFWPRYSSDLLGLCACLRPGVVLATVTEDLIRWLAGCLGIQARLDVIPPGEADASENLAIWTSKAEAKVYLSGRGASVYLRTEPFAARGLSIRFSNPVVAEGYATVSALTALFDYGAEWRCLLSRAD